jgi:hypothetical protein
MTAADELFRALGIATIDQRLERIAKDAAALQKRLQAGFHKNQLAMIHRWVTRQLHLCARTFDCAAPPELVLLLEYLLGAHKPERNGNRKNREKFIAAAHHVAQYPDATPAKIARAIKYEQKRIIRCWLDDREFKEIVNTRRLRLSYQQKRGA